ncbi:MAG: glucose-phosphate cytidylyltransferase [Acidimicrobiaceae bacterium]|jgi:glucose-1-phosphate cytidylyltransferase
MGHGGVPTVILCGGRGSRISDVNPMVPKPLLPIGGRPVLWHIMKIYATAGHTEFVLALGHLGDQIRRYVLDYEALTCDFSIELGVPNSIEFHRAHPEKGWRVSCIDTGAETQTGTRVRRAVEHIADGPVMITYGDAVADIDIDALLAHHRAEGRLATVTAVRPVGRFGELMIDGSRVADFAEKPQTTDGAISGGFMVFEREAIDRYIPAGDDVMLEREPLSRLAADGQLTAYRHDGFWQPMDTPREHRLLEELWQTDAPWRIWNEE